MAITLGDMYCGRIGQIQKNIAIMEEENDLAPHLKDRRLCETHLQGNTIWKPITWTIWVPRDRKIIVDKGNDTERWKAVKGVWHGSSKNNGKCCCGVRDKWITISTIGVP